MKQIRLPTGQGDPQAGAHTDGGPRGPSPLGPKNSRFSGFIQLNYVSCIFVACVFKLFVMWEGRGSLQHSKELT